MSAPHSPKDEKNALPAEGRLPHAARGAGYQALAAAHQESLARWRTAFDHSPLAQVVLDAALTIRQANPALLDLLGFPHAEDLAGYCLLDFAPSDQHAGWHRLQHHMTPAQRLPFFGETRLIRRDGSPLHCQLTATLAPNAQQAWSCVSLVELPGPVLPARQLSAEEYATIRHAISHDLRAPIAHIQLLTELLQRQAVKSIPDPQKTAQYLRLIERSCAETNALIKEVLRLLSLDPPHLGE